MQEMYMLIFLSRKKKLYLIIGLAYKVHDDGALLLLFLVTYS